MNVPCCRIEATMEMLEMKGRKYERLGRECTFRGREAKKVQTIYSFDSNPPVGLEIRERLHISLLLVLCLGWTAASATVAISRRSDWLDIPIFPSFCHFSRNVCFARTWQDGKKTWSIDPMLIVKFRIHEQVLEYLRAGYSRREGIDPQRPLSIGWAYPD